MFQIDTAKSSAITKILYHFNDVYEVGTGDSRFNYSQISSGEDCKLYGLSKLASLSSGHNSVFQLDLSGTNPIYKDLHFFEKPKLSYPDSGLIQANDGKFYGTASLYGDSETGKGGIYQLDVSSTKPILTEVHSFDQTGGYDEKTNLVLGKNGKIYGATNAGGAHNAGTFFQFDISASNAIYKNLYSFEQGRYHAQNPELIQGVDGKFYGIDSGFDDINYRGILYQLDTSSAPLMFNILHVFDKDGVTPSGILQGYNGSLYGTTETLYKFDLNPPLYKILYKFNQASGEGPRGLIQASDRKFYGVAYKGGSTTAVQSFK